MLLCDAPEFVRWRPDFSSSGQDSPEWTQVLCAGERVVNGLEAVEWEENPVQLVVCEACGITDCAYGGYAHVSRTGAHVVLSEPRPPAVNRSYEDHQDAASTAVVRHGAVVVPVAVWSGWPGVPPVDTLPSTRRRDLVGGWRAEAPPRADAIGTDSGDLEEALAAVDAVDRWFEADPEAVVHELLPLGEGGVTVFYDSPRFVEWTPVARVGDALQPVLGGRFTAVATSAGMG